MIIFDSNILIYLSKGVLSVETLFDENETYAISVITYMEVLGYKFKSSQEALFTKEVLSYFEVIYVDSKIAEEVVLLRKKYQVKLPDAIICASSIVNNATLYTNDIRLKVINELQIKQFS